MTQKQRVLDNLDQTMMFLTDIRNKVDANEIVLDDFTVKETMRGNALSFLDVHIELRDKYEVLEPTE